MYFHTLPLLSRVISLCVCSVVCELSIFLSPVCLSIVYIHCTCTFAILRGELVVSQGSGKFFIE